MLPVVASIRQRCAHKSDANSCSAAFEMREVPLAQKVCSAHATDPCTCGGAWSISHTEPCAVFMTGAVVTTELCVYACSNSNCVNTMHVDGSEELLLVKGTWKSLAFFSAGTFRTKSPATGSFCCRCGCTCTPTRLMLHPRPWLLLSHCVPHQVPDREDSIQYEVNLHVGTST
jgi:hypothetical protein